mmetsp:Transcript_60032/g.82502  ORF Transcript_60032/g.82502 Transcript_60032/m.82502 type:complete len:216 (-) Transcript_60032:77-724(-)
MAVVAALELDDSLAPGEGAHQADHAHARLRAAVREAHHLDGGHSLDHHLRQVVLQKRRGTEGGALLHLLVQGLQDGVIRVANDGRAPGADVVNVLVAINIPRIRALDPVKDHRVAAHGLEGADGARDTSWHDFLGLRKDLLGLLGLQADRGGRTARRLLRAALGGAHGHASDHGGHSEARGGCISAGTGLLLLRRGSVQGTLAWQSRGRRCDGRG